MKINQTLFCAMLFWGILLATQEEMYAFDNETTHREINKNAGRQSTLGDYMTKKLGYSDGIRQQFLRKEVGYWLQEGGWGEDEPKTNVLYHFHDPLKPWDSAGFGQSWSMGLTGSALLRAQSSSYEFTWSKARDHFYNALTTGSEQSYADTFLTLGHLMHLVSDMAVPAHVRMDPHLTLPAPWPSFIQDPDPFETYTAQHSADLIYTGTTVDQSIFNLAITTPKAPAPITALWDQDTYDGTNPGAAIPATAGLAEYTNANFFSKDTVYDYAYPAAGNTIMGSPEVVVAEDNKADTLIYLYGETGNSIPIKMGGISLIKFDAMKKDKQTPWQLDNNVNQEYASQLIPAAAGYSAALLDYFFRGDIDLKADPSGNGYLLVNNSDEDMTGTFELWYDANNGKRNNITLSNYAVAGKSQVQAEGITKPSDRANPANYTLIFTGTMGRENGAVAGRKVSLVPKECFLITMSTEFDTTVIPKEETPDIAIMWDMETNSYAKIKDINGTLISFPIDYQELKARTNNLADYQLGASEKLLALDSYSDPIPDCPLQRQDDSTSGKDDEVCNEWYHHRYIDTGTCDKTSVIEGKNNTSTVHVSFNDDDYIVKDKNTNPYSNDICVRERYITSSGHDTYEYDGTINSTGEDTIILNRNSYLLINPGYGITSIFPSSYKIFVINNNSGAEDLDITNSLSLKVSASFNYYSEIENTGYCVSGWANGARELSIIAIVNNDYFGSTTNLTSNALSLYTSHAFDQDYVCENGKYILSLPDESINLNSSLSALSNNASAIGIQSLSSNQTQFEIGIIYSPSREIHMIYSKILSGDTGTYTATYGQINHNIKAFCTSWPGVANNPSTYAQNTSPWALSQRESLEAAIEEMDEYFSSNYGEDPAQVRPDYFAPLNSFTPLTIAKKNLWNRKFDIQYLTAP